MKRTARFLAALLGALGLSPAAHAGCGAAPDACTIPGGTYHIELPQTAAPGHPSLMFIHGYGGSGLGSLGNRDTVDTALQRGYAVIAPDGMPRSEGKGNSWSFMPRGPQKRDEIAFLQAVRDDAAQRHGLNPDKMLLAGFSIGGSMTSYLACAVPGAFAAYAPVSGGFWRPHPDTCAGPVRLLHTHGWTDTTVPLEGRVLRGTDSLDPDALMQGDIFHTMNIWRETNACRQLRADSFVVTDQFWRRKWDRCSDGSALELVLFPGGHMVPKGWAALALDWFEGL
jgi:polyhydroxybutyrate depolymerase